MSDEKIKIQLHRLGDLILFIFSNSDNSFVLGKNDPAIVLSNFLEQTGLNGIITSGNITVDTKTTRKIWNKLINEHFEKMTQLDDLLNGTNDFTKKVDEALFCFKIRNKKTKKYSKGGSINGPWLWNNQGKTWNQINHVKSHFSHLFKTSENAYDDAELVILKEVRAVDLDDIDKVKDEVKKYKRRR